MSFTAPSLYELFKHPAQYVHETFIARSANHQQLLQQIATLDTDKRLAVFDKYVAELMSHSSALLNGTIADTVHLALNQQLSDLHWNRLSTHTFSCIFSFLPTKQVLELRRVCTVWNSAGKLPLSFGASEDNDTVVTLRRAGRCNLSGVVNLAVEVRSDDAVSTQFNQAGALLQCIASSQSNALTNLLIRNNDSSSHCSLTSLCQYDFRHQLRRLDCVVYSRDEELELLQAAAPFASLTSCSMTLHDGLDQSIIPNVMRLMPRLDRLTLHAEVLSAEDLQYLAHLPLQHLLVKCKHHVYDETPAVSLRQLADGNAVTPTLLSLRMTAPDSLGRLLLQSTSTSLSQIGTNIRVLYLRNVQHLEHFAAHLVQCQQLIRLELLTSVLVKRATATHRQELLHALAQLANLQTLKLHLEDEKDESDDDEEGDESEEEQEEVDAEYWCADDLRALLRLPLRELWVQDVAESAGEALDLYTASYPPSQKVLQLGKTNIEYSHLAAASDSLEKLSLHPNLYFTRNRMYITNRPDDLNVLLDKEAESTRNTALQSYLVERHPSVQCWHQWNSEIHDERV